MAIAKIPKKLKDILNILRNGQIEEGLEQLEKIKDFEVQKSIVKAEINYFKSNYQEALRYDEQSLPFDDQWYAGNILTEHLFAYSYFSIVSGNFLQAEKFLKQFLLDKENIELPEHRINFYRHQITHHLMKINGEKKLIIDPTELNVIKNGNKEEEFIEQLKKYRPKLDYNSVEGAEYLLNFMFEKYNTISALEYYEIYADKIKLEDHHINAARLYVKNDDKEKASEALLRFSCKAWWPVEHIQITPMKLLMFEDLQPILTQELKNKILYSPKANH
jgi:hypothetical protein